ncbi:response regulator transcription factor [Terriglobus sp. TAA 43]|uniref:response regulator transcription factor n=1 Tax=Terriglobus sp. TAA 43 TaxID=278961 RepID=UPI000645C61A|nr:LuxR C-terminal-related transcriptional regulator [Terriglobus sp. TAA 43]
MKIVYTVVEDLRLSHTLHTALAANGVAVISLHSSSECLSHENRHVASCLLLSEGLAGMDCGSLPYLRERNSPPIIIISVNGDVPSCVRALRKGAHDYLTVPLMAPRLFQAIESAFDADRRLRAELQETAELRSRWASLTTREAEIMHYAVRGFLNKQTAAELKITENTVQVHRGRVMRKMHATSLAELVLMSVRLSS